VKAQKKSAKLKKKKRHKKDEKVQKKKEVPQNMPREDAKTSPKKWWKNGKKQE
jgi:hypothetical protein